MNDKLKDIREGDTVEVTFRASVQRVFSPSQLIFVVADGGDNALSINDREIASPHFSIKKVEKPLAVGDRVTWGGGLHFYEVLHVDGGKAFLAGERSWGRDHQIYEVSELRRVSK